MLYTTVAYVKNTTYKQTKPYTNKAGNYNLKKKKKRQNSKNRFLKVHFL